MSDPKWQFLGYAIAFTGILVAIWIYWLQRPRKELAFGVISSQRLLSVSDSVSSRVKVEFDGKPVGNVHLIVYALKNSGHRGVVPTDFERKFRIFSSEGIILSAELTSQTPSNLNAKIEFTETSVELDPLLLNVGDQLLFQILVSASEPKLEVDARILDIPKLMQINAHPKAPPILESGLPWAFGAFGIMGSLLILVDQNNWWHYLEPEKEPTPAVDIQLHWAFLGLFTLMVIQIIVMRLSERFGPKARRNINNN